MKNETIIKLSLLVIVKILFPLFLTVIYFLFRGGRPFIEEIISCSYICSSLFITLSFGYYYIHYGIGKLALPLLGLFYQLNLFSSLLFMGLNNGDMINYWIFTFPVTFLIMFFYIDKYIGEIWKKY